ncbi:MAG TPA: hypothetical protein VE912_18285 [Bacteroidales bacterium]|nr:hypothetical protein [Bacteroidales bacterium]
MTHISGIRIEKDNEGRPAYARFNLKKHPEILDLLQRIGALEMEDDFEKEWGKGLSIEEVRKEMYKQIDEWFKK